MTEYFKSRFKEDSQKSVQKMQGVVYINIDEDRKVKFGISHAIAQLINHIVDVNEITTKDEIFFL